MTDEGALRLASAILEDASKEYRIIYKAYLQKNYKKNSDLIHRKERLEKMFRTIPFIHMLSMSGDDVIKKLQDQVKEELKESKK